MQNTEKDNQCSDHTSPETRSGTESPATAAGDVRSHRSTACAAAASHPCQSSTQQPGHSVAADNGDLVFTVKILRSHLKPVAKWVAWRERRKGHNVAYVPITTCSAIVVSVEWQLHVR